MYWLVGVAGLVSTEAFFGWLACPTSRSLLFLAAHFH
jgi:hypothetical protein